MESQLSLWMPAIKLAFYGFSVVALVYVVRWVFIALVQMSKRFFR